MKHTARQLITAALLASFGLIAAAQPAAPSQGGAPMQRGERMGRFDPAQMQQRMQERMQERIARRQAKLKETLQITPPQEGAWTAWTSAMRPPANWKRTDRAELQRLPTPERIDRMRVLRVERMATMDRRADATKVFYATLNPVQKRVFDLETARGHRRGGERGERGGHGGHRGHHMR
jgi:protein CpxP